jgi:hypothetical protein
MERTNVYRDAVRQLEKMRAAQGRKTRAARPSMAASSTYIN